MKVAITGGTGFVGRHLAQSLLADGHTVVLIARGKDQRDPSVNSEPGVTVVYCDVSEQSSLATALQGCDAVAHCAGINRELGEQTFQKVHVEGTRVVVEAAKAAAVNKILLISFLRARENGPSKYHRSKAAAEEVVRNSGINYTILKPGVIYGKGDHMLDHLSHAFYSVPIFGLVGLKEKQVAPLAVQDLIVVMKEALVNGGMPNETLYLIGPQHMTLSTAVKTVAKVVGREPVYFRMPIFCHLVMAWMLEHIMTIPLVSIAQIFILSEGVTEPAPPCSTVPAHLLPKTGFTETSIRPGLPKPEAFGLHDLLCWKATT